LNSAVIFWFHEGILVKY